MYYTARYAQPAFSFFLMKLSGPSVYTKREKTLNKPRLTVIHCVIPRIARAGKSFLFLLVLQDARNQCFIFCAWHLSDVHTCAKLCIGAGNQQTNCSET